MRILFLFVGLSLAVSLVTFAQHADISAASLAKNPEIRATMKWIDGNSGSIARFLAKIGGIVSPSGQENERAEAIYAKMKAIGLKEVTLDTLPNVHGIIPGQSDSLLIFVSTLDDLATVAIHQKARPSPPIVREDKVVGPGTNTSATTAAMLAAAEAVLASGTRPYYTLLFASVAQEETGLVGMKALHRQLKDRAVAFVDILGHGDRITYGAIVIHWWKVVAKGPAGHTLRGELPNINQGIARAVDRIFQLPQPQVHASQETHINIAILNSGKVFNHKPDSGFFSLDIRSLDQHIVEEMESDIAVILDGVSQETDIALRMEPFELTPGGQLEGFQNSRLVRLAEQAATFLGAEGQLSNAGSSNMNVAIAAGTPAIGLGGDRGGDRGYPSEWASIPNMLKTAKLVSIISLTMQR